VAHIWSDLEGAGAHAEVLRQSFIRQVAHFLDRVRALRDKFCDDCTDANDRGLEQDLLSRSPFLTRLPTKQTDSIAVLKSKSRASSVRRRSTVGAPEPRRRAGYGGGYESELAERWEPPEHMHMEESKDEFGVDSDSGAIYLSIYLSIYI
jgi:hypothetical protein